MTTETRAEKIERIRKADDEGLTCSGHKAHANRRELLTIVAELDRENKALRKGLDELLTIDKHIRFKAGKLRYHIQELLEKADG